MLRRWLEWTYWCLFVLAVGFLCLVTGFVTTELQVFPFDYFRDAFLAMRTPSADAKYHSDLYLPVPTGGAGVTRYDPERAYNGYTLFTSGDTQGAFLVDMQGRVVHRWLLPYSKVLAEAHAPADPYEWKGISWRKAFLYPNGDLLVVFEGFDFSLWGRGIAKIDRNSNIIWTYLAHMHHDVEVGPDGRIYALEHERRRKFIPQLPEITPPSNEGFVVVLSPDGKLLKKVSIYRAFANSRYRGVIGLIRACITGDTIHTNSVQPMPHSFAKIFPFAGPNTVLLSFRHLDSIALLDLDAEKIIWLLHGPFARQHDARFLANGDMTVFDDLGDIAHGGNSRVLEFVPDPFRIVWEFPGDSPEKLSSQIFGAAQKLPNGNVLVTEADNARLLEVTPDKKVVWEYRNPVRLGPGKQLTSVLFWAHRFAPGDLHFDFNHSVIAVDSAQRDGE
jgi:Arylsulfotransferase (ASST)